MERLITQLKASQELTVQDIEQAADFLLDENASLATKGEFLNSLSDKGESPAEIAGFVECFLKRAVDPKMEKVQRQGPRIDVCGTGGDKLNLFNVSTTSMFVIAAAGAVVVKHGNRGITSKSGGADVLEALGVKLDVTPAQFRACLEGAGVGFLFAPMYHPTFKAVAPVRQALAKQGIRTIFNLIGPLLNPARPEFQLVGICDKGLGEAYAEILQRLGRQCAWVVNGRTADGAAVDEMSLMGETQVCVSGSGIEPSERWVEPEDVGLNSCQVEALTGGEAEENAKILQDVLSGKERGAKRDMVLFNAGAGIACAGLVNDLAAGVERAAELIDSGAALERLRLLQQLAV